MQFHMRSASWVIAVTWAVAGLPAAAQVGAGATPSAPAQANNVAKPADVDTEGDIVVTANKRSESVSRVGMAITALTGEQLLQQGVTSVAQLARIEPSLVVSESKYSAPTYTIRGVGYNDYAIAASPTVSVYVDQVPYAFLAESKGASLDLERVEILKGPQGTLFGQNATGGAVNFIAGKPTSSLSAGADFSIDSFGQGILSGFVSGPITDTLRVRLAADTDQGGGSQRSATYGDRLGDHGLTRVRLLAEFKPSDRLTINLNGNYFMDDGDTRAAQAVGLAPQKIGPYPNTAVASPALRGRTFPDIVGLTAGAAPTNDEQADWYHGVHPAFDEHYGQITARIDYRFSDAATLTYVGGIEDYRQDDISTPSGRTQASYFEQKARVHANNHELRLTGTLGPVTYLIGGTYTFAHVNENDLLYYAGITTAYSTITLPFLTGLTPGYADPTTGSNPVADSRTKTAAGFGNVEVKMTDTLKLHAGGRYTDSRNHYEGCSRAIDAPGALAFDALQIIAHVPAPKTVGTGDCLTFDPTGHPNLFVGDLNEHNFSWRAGIDWTPAPRTLIYGTVSKGYKAGSFPVPAASSYVQLQPVTQESVLAYEIGAKSRLFRGKVDVEGALFYYDYRDKQLTSNRPDPLGIFGIVNALVNVPKSAEKGAELTVRLRPLGGVTLTGQTTYLDSYVRGDFTGFEQFSTVPINLNGEAFPNTPKWSVNGGARYDFDLNGRLHAFVSGNVRYQSRAQGAFGTQVAIDRGFPSLYVDAYTVGDVTLGVEPPSRNWHAQLFVNNVANTYYWTQALRIFDGTVRYAGTPRTAGIRVGFRL